VIAGLVLLVGGAAAGVFGSLLGLGGGVLIVPLLTLGFGLPLREAVAVSLVSVIVTSSASAGVYLEKHVANLRLGMVLELFSASGALVGGLVAFMLPANVLEGLFAALLVWVAISMVRRKEPSKDAAPTPEVADDVPASPAFTDTLGGAGYRVHSLPFGMAGSVFAGLMSALLGIGAGIVKVPTMHLLMGVPLKIATATSNMMIGITAVSSAVIYLLRGQIDPFVAGPTAVGVFAGAMIGTRIAPRVDVRVLRWLFVVVLAYTAFQMGLKALGL
jgi:uncharacterized membrane protein YfcA